MTGFQWLVLGWLTSLTVAYVLLRLSLVGLLSDLLRVRIRIQRDTAALVTQALTAHSEAPLRQAHPGGQR